MMIRKGKQLVISGFPDDLSGQISKNQIMQGDDAIPIDSTPKPFGQEMRGLDQFVGLNVKFQPGPAGDFHLSQQQKPFVFPYVRDFPEIKRISYP